MQMKFLAKKRRSNMKTTSTFNKGSVNYSNGRFFNIFVHVGLILNVIFAIWLLITSTT